MRKFLAIALFCLLPPLCSAAGLHVLLIPSGDEVPYRNFCKAFRQSLPAGIQLEELKIESFTGKEKADLVVTVGMKAAGLALNRTTLPVIASMIPSYSFAALKQIRPNGLSAIFVDQPWDRQVRLLRAAFPERTRVGLLTSPRSNLDISDLRLKLEEAGDTLLSEEVPEGTLFGKLEKTLSGSQILLAVPDSAIYNSNSIRDILLSSYRYRVPMVGFSEAFVDAGAICAIYSTPEQLAAQAGAMLGAYLKLGRLPEPEFPKLFKISVNHEVSSMLGIPIPSRELLILKLEREGATR
ncbi:MAG: hypothetical protein HKL98_02720 [Burkholderiales bacterium]|nr:hypothetical protein [Burkholderiales bacterium]